MGAYATIALGFSLTHHVILGYSPFTAREELKVSRMERGVKGETTPIFRKGRRSGSGGMHQAPLELR